MEFSFCYNFKKRHLLEKHSDVQIKAGTIWNSAFKNLSTGWGGCRYRTRKLMMAYNTRVTTGNCGNCVGHRAVMNPFISAT